MKRNSRRGAALLLTLLLLACAVCFAACGPEPAEPPEEQQTPLAPSGDGTYEDGGKVLCMSPSLEISPSFVAERTGLLPKEMAFTSTTSVAVNCLLDGVGDRLLTVLPVADFYADRSERLKAIPCTETVDLSMLVAYQKPELAEVLNRALSDMKEDGTLDALYAAWVTAFEKEGRPEDSEEPVTFAPSHSETVIRVGFSGTLPLIDYILPDGEPGGFTAALFNELQVRTGYAVESRHVLPESKISALLNNQIDVYLWHFLEVPEVVLSTDPYWTVPLAFLEAEPLPGDPSGE